MITLDTQAAKALDIFNERAADHPNSPGPALCNLFADLTAGRSADSAAYLVYLDVAEYMGQQLDARTSGGRFHVTISGLVRGIAIDSDLPDSLVTNQARRYVTQSIRRTWLEQARDTNTLPPLPGRAQIEAMLKEQTP